MLIKASTLPLLTQSRIHPCLYNSFSYLLPLKTMLHQATMATSAPPQKDKLICKLDIFLGTTSLFSQSASLVSESRLKPPLMYNGPPKIKSFCFVGYTILFATMDSMTHERTQSYIEKRGVMIWKRKKRPYRNQTNHLPLFPPQSLQELMTPPPQHPRPNRPRNSSSRASRSPP